METEKEKSLNIDELKKKLESENLKSIRPGECVEENSSLKKDLDSEKLIFLQNKEHINENNKSKQDLVMEKLESEQGKEKAKDTQECLKSALEAQKLDLLTVQSELTEKKSNSTK